MISYLIIGGSEIKRKEKADQIAIQKRASSFDTIYITGESSIGITQVREVERQLTLKPFNSPFKAVVIHPGQLLTIEAQNALLKTLEEPGEQTIIILTAPRQDTFLPTVVSRCQIIKLTSKPEILLTEEEFDSVFSLLLSVLYGGVGERLKIASQIGKTKEDIKQWLTKMIFVCRDLLVNKKAFFYHSRAVPTGRQESGNPEECWIPDPLQDKQVGNNKVFSKENLLLPLTPIQIVKLIKNAEKTKAMLDQNINPRLALEIFLLDLPTISTDFPDVRS